MPVELRKRKAPAPPPEPPAAKKQSKVAKVAAKVKEAVKPRGRPPKAAPAEAPAAPADAPATNGLPVTGKPQVGDIISLEGFGGEVETNDGVKTSLKALVDESKAGVVLFTYPKASTPGCKYRNPLSRIFRRQKSSQFHPIFIHNLTSHTHLILHHLNFISAAHQRAIFTPRLTDKFPSAVTPSPPLLHPRHTHHTNTPSGTTQVCLFRDSYTPLTAGGLAIYGLSTDSPKANTTFQTKQKLPYPLLCDPSATLIGAIGLKKAPKGTTRGVFVVDKQGKVLVAEPGGPAATLAAVKKLVEELAGPEAAAEVEKIPVPAEEPEAEAPAPSVEVDGKAEEKVEAAPVPTVVEPVVEKKDVEMTDAPNGDAKSSSVAPEAKADEVEKKE